MIECVEAIGTQSYEVDCHALLSDTHIVQLDIELFPMQSFWVEVYMGWPNDLCSYKSWMKFTIYPQRYFWDSICFDGFKLKMWDVKKNVDSQKKPSAIFIGPPFIIPFCFSPSFTLWINCCEWHNRCIVKHIFGYVMCFRSLVHILILCCWCCWWRLLVSWFKDERIWNMDVFVRYCRIV